MAFRKQLPQYCVRCCRIISEVNVPGGNVFLNLRDHHSAEDRGTCDQFQSGISFIFAVLLQESHTLFVPGPVTKMGRKCIESGCRELKLDVGEAFGKVIGERVAAASIDIDTTDQGLIRVHLS